MRLVLDKDQIVSFALIGDLDNSIEVDDSIIPDDFMENFKPNYYLYDNNIISINTNYKEPALVVPDVKPSESQKLLMSLSQNVATLQSMIMAQNQQMAQLMAKEAKQYDDANANATYLLGYVG